MNDVISEDRTTDLARIRLYLTALNEGVKPSLDLSTEWKTFAGQCELLIRSQVRRRVRRDQQADDLIQEIWLKVVKLLREEHRVPSSQSWKWMGRVIRNHLVDLLRQNQSRRQIFDDESLALDEVPDSRHSLIEDWLDEDQLNHWLGQLQSRVSEATFETVRLRLLKKASLKDIGRKLGMSKAQAKTQFHRGYRELQAIVSAGGGGGEAPNKAAEKKWRFRVTDRYQKSLISIELIRFLGVSRSQAFGKRAEILQHPSEDGIRCLNLLNLEQNVSY